MRKVILYYLLCLLIPLKITASITLELEKIVTVKTKPGDSLRSLSVFSWTYDPDDNLIVFPVKSGKIYCVDLNQEQIKWIASIPETGYIYPEPVITSKRVLLRIKDKTGKYFLVSVDKVRGTIRETSSFFKKYIYYQIDDKEFVYVLSDDQFLKLNPGLETLWKISLPGKEKNPYGFSIVGRFIAIVKEGMIILLDTITRQIVWQKELDHRDVEIVYTIPEREKISILWQRKRDKGKRIYMTIYRINNGEEIETRVFPYLGICMSEHLSGRAKNNLYFAYTRATEIEGKRAWINFISKIYSFNKKNKKINWSKEIEYPVLLIEETSNLLFISTYLFLSKDRPSLLVLNPRNGDIVFKYQWDKMLKIIIPNPEEGYGISFHAHGNHLIALLSPLQKEEYKILQYKIEQR